MLSEAGIGRIKTCSALFWVRQMITLSSETISDTRHGLVDQLYFQYVENCVCFILILAKLFY